MRVVHGAALLLGMIVVGAFPAAAHPFGAPAAAEVSAEGRQVTVVWSAEPDDLVALGHHVGAFDGAADHDHSHSAAQMLAGSPDVEKYLRQQIGVAQDGEPCDARTVETTQIAADGARMTFECAREIAAVEIRIAMLVDVDPAYRTLLRSGAAGEPRRAVLTGASPLTTVTYPPGGAPAAPAGNLGGSVAGLPLGPLALAAALLAAAAAAAALVSSANDLRRGRAE